MLSATVGPAWSAQQIPFWVTAWPPSSVTFPPVVKPLAAILVAAVVVIAGRPFLSFLQQGMSIVIAIAMGIKLLIIKI
jgi:hypothetical protein